jgi:hypothetical protein
MPAALCLLPSCAAKIVGLKSLIPNSQRITFPAAPLSLQQLRSTLQGGEAEARAVIRSLDTHRQPHTSYLVVSHRLIGLPCHVY